jgi:hypothetical protein
MEIRGSIAAIHGVRFGICGGGRASRHACGPARIAAVGVTRLWLAVGWRRDRANRGRAGVRAGFLVSYLRRGRAKGERRRGRAARRDGDENGGRTVAWFSGAGAVYKPRLM